MLSDYAERYGMELTVYYSLDGDNTRRNLMTSLLITSNSLENLQAATNDSIRAREKRVPEGRHCEPLLLQRKKQ